MAREAEIAYSTLGLVTDYDCWRTDESDVNIEEILEILKTNSSFAKRVVVDLSKRLLTREPSMAASCALDAAIITPLETVAPNRIEQLKTNSREVFTRMFPISKPSS